MPLVFDRWSGAFFIFRIFSFKCFY